MFEIRQIGRHAGTVLVGQLAVMAFGLTDTVVAGRYSPEDLASLSVGSAVFISVFVAFMGIIQSLLPVWAEHHGAGRQEIVGKTLRQSLYLCAIIVVLGMSILLFPGQLLKWAQVPESLQPAVRGYLNVLAFGFPPALLFRLYSTFNQSLGRPLLVTWVQIGSLFLKVPLSIVFAFGMFGLPEGGAVGCAWATLVVNYLMLAFAIGMLRTQKLYAPYKLWDRMEKPDWKQIGDFARLGVPGGLAVMVEVTSFTLMALFISRIGVVASASHQVASNVAALCYMIPLSLAIATSARVSFWNGAGRLDNATAVMRTGFIITVGLALVMASIVFFGRHTIAALYSPTPAVVATASGMLVFIALYHLSDGVQTLSIFLLRCFRVTVMPFVIYCVLLWGVGLTGGYLLAYKDFAGHTASNAPITFWQTSSTALALTAATFVLLLFRTVKRVRREGGWQGK